MSLNLIVPPSYAWEEGREEVVSIIICEGAQEKGPIGLECERYREQFWFINEMLSSPSRASTLVRNTATDVVRRRATIATFSSPWLFFSLFYTTNSIVS